MTGTTLDRIRQTIHESGLDVEQFATKAEMPPDRLAHIVSGDRRATSLDLALVAEASGCNLDWLMLGDGPERIGYLDGMVADLIKERNFWRNETYAAEDRESPTGRVIVAVREQVTGRNGGERSTDLIALTAGFSPAELRETLLLIAADAINWLSEIEGRERLRPA